MEDDAVVVAVTSQAHEIVDRVGRQLGVERHGDLTLVRVDHHVIEGVGVDLHFGRSSHPRTFARSQAHQIKPVHSGSQARSPFVTDTPALSTGKRRPAWLVPVAVVVVVIVVIVAGLGGSYNGLVKKRNAVDQQFSNVDVQLQRRFDLIPNLANAVKAALGQEQAVYGEIAAARNAYATAGSSDQKVAASNQLDSGFGLLLGIVQQYPPCRATKTFATCRCRSKERKTESRRSDVRTTR